MPNTENKQNDKEYYMGLDISTQTVGICLMNCENSNLSDLRYISLAKIKKVESDPELMLYLKKKMFMDTFIDVIEQEYKIKEVFIEAPLYRSNNQFTVITLAKFNALVSCGLHERGYRLTHISEHECRKNLFPEYVKLKKGKGGEMSEVLSYPQDADKKLLVWEKINRFAPYIKWPTNTKGELIKEAYDMSDSFAVCLAGAKLRGTSTTILPN